jgi:hypothetical protein
MQQPNVNNLNLSNVNRNTINKNGNRNKQF